jgi:hypothetical protein
VSQAANNSSVALDRKAKQANVSLLSGLRSLSALSLVAHPANSVCGQAHCPDFFQQGRTFAHE